MRYLVYIVLSSHMSILKNWISKVRQSMFSYEDGFFIFPVLGNSPNSIVYGFRKTPFVKVYPDKNRLVTKTPFITGDAYYQELEEGLWIIYSVINYKRNICFKICYDPNQTTKYYTLTLDCSSSANNTVHLQSGHSIETTTYYWRFFKPIAITRGYHYKSSRSKNITIYISENWMREYVQKQNLFNNARIWFEDFSAEVLFIPHLSINNRVSLQKIFDTFESNEERSIDLLDLKVNCLAMLHAFLKELDNYGPNKLPNLKPKDEARILLAEQIIKNSIFSGFPSIHKLSEEIGISETKLKAEFKTVFGSTLFQYFAQCQMDTAEKMLESGKDSIKSVAYTLGYTHPGKFSAAFKKIKGKLPSEINSLQPTKG
ncbi:MAG: AraC family transcriptional regulator [Cyclobacteriaceae bacterium]